MSTIGTIVDRVRVRLEEDTARKWSDADQLIPYASEAERWLARMLSRIKRSGRFRYREEFTLAASTETFDLTTLTKRFDWLVSLSVKFSNVWVPVVQFEEEEEQSLSNFALGGGYPIPRVSLADDTLVFEPTFGSARTCRIRYGWIPTIKTSTSDTVQTPTEYDGDVVQRTLHFALSDAGMANTKFEEQYAVRLAEIEDLERSRFGTSNEKVVRRARTFSRCR